MGEAKKMDYDLLGVALKPTVKGFREIAIADLRDNIKSKPDKLNNHKLYPFP